VGTGEGERAVRQVRRQSGRHRPQRLEVVRGQPDGEAVRDDRPLAVANAVRLHRPLEAPLHLDGPQPSSEEPGGLALEEPLEEPLDGGKGSHVGGGV